VRDSAPTLTTTYYSKTTTYHLEELLASRGLQSGASKAEMIERLEAEDQTYTATALPTSVPRLDDQLYQTNDQSLKLPRVLDGQLPVAAQPALRYARLNVNIPTFSSFGGRTSVNLEAAPHPCNSLNVVMPTASHFHSQAAPVVELAPRYAGLNFDMPTLSHFHSQTCPAAKAAPTGSAHMNSSMSIFNTLLKSTSQLNGQTSPARQPDSTRPDHRNPSPIRAPLVPTSASTSSSAPLKNDSDSETKFEVYVPLCPYRLTRPPPAIPPTALRSRPSDLEGGNKLDLYPIGRKRIRKRPSPSSCTDQSEPAPKRPSTKCNQPNRSYLQQTAEETNQLLSCTPLASSRTSLSFGCTPLPSGRTSLPMWKENSAQTGSFLNSWNGQQSWNISPNKLNFSNAAGNGHGDSGANDSGYNNVGVFQLVSFLPQKVHDEVVAHHLQLAPPSNIVNWLTRGLIPKEVLDEFVAHHMRIAPAKDIVNWLAGAERLGFTGKDMVDEDLEAILPAADVLHDNENPTMDVMH
jgi:hypothetical protein